MEGEAVFIAWDNGEKRWMNRVERADAITVYNEYVRSQPPMDELTDEQVVELLQIIGEKERLERIHRAEVDLLYFVHEYFSDVRNEGNGGNWEGFDIESTEEAAQFHKEICEIMDDVSNVNRSGKTAVAAPRGHGKSSYLSKGGPLRDVVFRKRKYIIAISETDTVAKANLDWIAGQLKFNRKLREDFGELLSPKQQLNARDNGESFITCETDANSERKMLTLVEASSTGKTLRGRNWNGSRPDLIICDDLEDPRSNASTPEQRAKLRDWFSQTVIPLGDPKGERTALVYMGTIVHAESNLNIVITERSDFRTKLYKALIKEPNRADLWEQCRAIYKDTTLEIEERATKAEQFYLDNREDMDEGAEVLWPEVQPIWRLMTWKWNEGSKAFNTEYQNTPRDEESQIFVPENFTKYTPADLVRPNGAPINLRYYAFWDVALGRRARSDYNAIVTIGKDQTTGVIYVVDAWAQKCTAQEALRIAVEKIREFGHHRFSVETIGAGADMYRQLRERLREEGIANACVKDVSHQSAKKDIRIESMQPLIEDGFIQFNINQQLLFEQLEQFPTGTHDDLPDALSSAVSSAGGSKRRRKTSARKPYGL